MSEYQDILNILEACSNLSNEGNKGIVRAIDESNYINKFIAAKGISEARKELKKQKVYNAALEGNTISEKELREIVFDITPTPLLERVRIFNSNYLTLKVKELDTDGSIKVITYDFVGDTEKILLSTSEEEFIELGVDYIQSLVSSKANEVLEDNLINTIEGTFTTKADSLATAYNGLSKQSKRNATIIINHSEYVSNIDMYKDLDKIDIVLAPVTGRYLVDMSKVVLNYVIGSLSFKKNIKTGEYDIGMNLYNLSSKVIDIAAKTGSAF